MRILTLSLGLAAAGPLGAGCHKSTADKAAADAPSPDSVKQSFAALKKQFADMQQSFADLSKDVEAIPSDIPNYPHMRASFYAAEEARGVTDAKMTLLQGRLDAAVRSGKPEELRQVSNDIAKTSGDARQLGELYVKLLHAVMAFQRVAEQRKAPPVAAAGGPAPSPPAKAEHKKSER